MRVRDNNGAEIDATYSLEQRGDAVVLVYESRGPDPRNSAYNAGLDILLGRLAEVHSSVIDGLLASRETVALPSESRRIDVDGYPYPIALDTVSDLGRFRQALGGAQARLGRAPGATGAGNPTKRIELFLSQSVNIPFDQLAKYLDRQAQERRFWALCANPRRYRIAEAVRDLEVDFWTTAGREVALGDGVAIWQTQDDAHRRGVVALGEVVGPPRQSDDAENLYWIDPLDRAVVAERVPVRYVVPAAFPLWLEEAGNEFLGNLSVARARGGTVFRLGADEWRTLSDAGGSPVESEESFDLIGEVRPRALAGQGRSMDPVVRKVVEQYAMKRATTYFSKPLGQWTLVQDVSSRACFDLLCSEGSREMRVEVKGTTGDGLTVLMTKNEVEHARRMYPHVALFITADIEVDRSVDPPTASGGRDVVFDPWDIATSELVALAFEVRIGGASERSG